MGDDHYGWRTTFYSARYGQLYRATWLLIALGGLVYAVLHRQDWQAVFVGVVGAICIIVIMVAGSTVLAWRGPIWLFFASPMIFALTGLIDPMTVPSIEVAAFVTAVHAAVAGGVWLAARRG